MKKVITLPLHNTINSIFFSFFNSIANCYRLFKENKPRIKYSIWVFMLLPILGFSQSKSSNNTKEEGTYYLTRKSADEKVSNSIMLRMKEHTEIPNYIKLKKGEEIPFQELDSWISDFYTVKNVKHGLKLLNTETDNLGMDHFHYQQTINGYPVVLSRFIAHGKNDVISSVNGDFFSKIRIPESITLSEEEALNNALKHINADIYEWEVSDGKEIIKEKQSCSHSDDFPQGELVLINVDGEIDKELKLTYKFTICSHKPFGKKEVYVDVEQGDIIWEHNLIHHSDITGTAVTAYSGVRDIITDSIAPDSYRLRETGRGNGIETYDMNCNSNYSLAVDFLDEDNHWDNVNPELDQYATDVHWGTEMTYDYFLNVHGRNSIDGNGLKLISYVHYDSSYFNAFWDGAVMTYGDGGLGGSTPLTSIAIVGHEITHGLTQHTAGLIYYGESGALNESFSDIFGSAIDFTYNPGTANWILGDEINYIIRNMEDPNSVQNPNTYLGNYWGAPYAVHTNSAIQNLWFVLLTEGGVGTNDNGDDYQVSSIGLSNACKIAFRNLSVYLTPSSDYYDARFYSIQSAIDLFGTFSVEHEAVVNAWHAVGIGDRFKRYIRVPDNNFEEYLETHDANGLSVPIGDPSSMGNGILEDDTILVQNVYQVTNLSVNNLNIADLTGIEGFVSLEELNCAFNSLNILDVSNNTALNDLQCEQNQLTSLDVSQNTLLTTLSCQFNHLSTLDISDNHNLTNLTCTNNQFTTLDLRNGNNTSLLNANFSCINNLDLYCIEVDDSLWSANNWNNIDPQHTFSANCPGGYGCTDPTALNYDPTAIFDDGECKYPQTFVPDDNFEEYLETHDANGLSVPVGDPSSMGNGIINDDSVITERIDIVTNLSVNSLNIADLTGIEDFISLEILNCSWNLLTNLDLSSNIELTSLDCQDNYITFLDVTNCPLLYYLDADNNDFTTVNVSNNIALTDLDLFSCDNINYLDVTNNTSLEVLWITHSWITNLDVSQNIGLTYLYCYANQLTSLDVTNNYNLYYLSCFDNHLFSLDVTNNYNLSSLYCNINQLTSLDVSNNIALGSLWCSSNLLTSLDISNNYNLYYLSCFDNQITSLDVSNNTSLTYFTCNDNPFLSSLDLRNGNNANIQSLYTWNFDLSNNPNLYCINVDDSVYSANNWTIAGGYIDPQHYFSADCASLFTTDVPDINFETYLEANGMGNGVSGDKLVFTSNINTVQYLPVSNLNINTLEGIEDFTALQYLDCSNNNLTDLNVSHNTPLLNLKCFGNQLTSLNVSNNTLLDYLSVKDNDLLRLDITHNSFLTFLDCSDNKLNNLFLANNSQIYWIACENNKLLSLDVSSLSSLVTLTCQGNLLTSLDLRNGNCMNFVSQNPTTPHYSPALDTRNNPNLTCINVDFLNAVSNWTTQQGFYLDAQQYYDMSCLATEIEENEVEIINTLDIFPNPSRDMFNIRFISEKINTIDIRIYNIIGEIVYAEHLEYFSGEYFKEINLSNYSKSFYFLNIETEDQEINRKLILQ
ncbi:M4 family metallopeptidase [Flavobacteriales bacterium]|nr:M4 family metallopeptidase [Flavobacteriales bacterium]